MPEVFHDVMKFLSTPSARRATVRPIPSSAGNAQFLSTPSARRATGTVRVHLPGLQEFLSTPSARRATWPCTASYSLSYISIHALREEGDLDTETEIEAVLHFYPRPPRGGRPQTRPCISGSEDFYPRPPRGGRPMQTVTEIADIQFLSTPSARRATLRVIRVASEDFVFLSTPSARRATRYLPGSARAPLFLSTPSARRATDYIYRKGYNDGISIHALREEGDLGAQVRQVVEQAFLSTPSARRATDQLGRFAEGYCISIHALREEGDNIKLFRSSGILDFYPRPPRGGRQTRVFRGTLHRNFYPRPPRGGRHRGQELPD